MVSKSMMAFMGRSLLAWGEPFLPSRRFLSWPGVAQDCPSVRALRPGCAESSAPPEFLPDRPGRLAASRACAYNSVIDRREDPMQQVAKAMRRAASILEQRPAAGVHDDAPALVRWMGGLRTEARHEEGHTVATDMPAELGGAGREVTPGWLVRSGIAACTATAIAAIAAERGITLEALEVQATSRSDTRGYLGLAEPDGRPVGAGPVEMKLHVSIRAPGVAEAELRALVEQARRRAPMTAMVTESRALPLTLTVEAA
jgi:uncharacterized OsmC-like protein